MPLPLGDPDSTAVVFIECQNGVFGEDAAIPALQASLAGVVDRLVELAVAARTSGVRVVHATCEGAGPVPHTPAPLYRLIASRSADWAPGHPATQVIDELADPGDVILPRRRGLLPTHNTDLLPSLRAFGVRTVVFAGASTNIAVTGSTLEATEEGFGVVIARDAVHGTPQEYSDAVIANTLGMLATLTDVESLKAHWQAAAGVSG